MPHQNYWRKAIINMSKEKSLSTQLKILNQRGLHARAAAKLVQTVSTFTSDIRVIKGAMNVSGRSIMGLMMLAAAPGCSIEIRATGDDADTALAAIVDLVGRKFDEN